MSQRLPSRFMVCLVGMLLLAACGKDEKKPQRPLPPPAPPAPKIERVTPTLGHALAERTREALEVTVDESVEGPSYTYLKVHDTESNGWVVAPALTVPDKAEITIEQYVHMRDFEALEIGRRFDHVLVALRVNGAGVVLKETGEEAAVDPVLPASGVTMTEVSIRRVKIAKADLLLAEVNAQSAELAGRRVKIRGQVLRVMPRIRDRNWIWLRDGSGEQRDATLAVVIDRPVDPGQVLLLEGRVSVNRKFRIGGAHPVLLEDAVVLELESEALLPEEDALGPPPAPTALNAPAPVAEPGDPTTTTR